MNIILIGSPEGQTTFVQSMQASLPCEVQSNAISFTLPEREIPVTIRAMGVDEANATNNADQLSQADAVIYAGTQAMHKNRLECEYLSGLNAGTLLKNLYQLLQDHHSLSHSC